MNWKPPAEGEQPKDDASPVESGWVVQEKRVDRRAIFVAAAIAVAFVAVVLVGILSAGANDDDMTPSDAYCSDLRNGATVTDLWDREQDPQDYADAAYGRMAISCPEQLERFRTYFESWGIDIDA